MKKQGFGKILNINSVNGLDAKEKRSVYIASKWALTGFSKGLREDLYKHNIQVMDLHPSLIKTTLFKNGNGKRDMSNAMDVDEVVKVIGFMLSFDGTSMPESLVLKDMHYE
jgi:short-subunit dehydrogenase